jgi:hypothetical protein
MQEASSGGVFAMEKVASEEIMADDDFVAQMKPRK